MFAFALLCVVTAAAVAGGIYVQARTAILQRTQDAAVQAMTSRLEALYPLRSATPGPDELGEIAAAAADQNGFAIAVYGEMHSPLPAPAPVTGALEADREGPDLGSRDDSIGAAAGGGRR